MPGLEPKTGQVSGPRRGSSQPQGPGWMDSGAFHHEAAPLCLSHVFTSSILGEAGTLQEERAGGSPGPHGQWA